MTPNMMKERQNRIRTLPAESETAKADVVLAVSAEEFAVLSATKPLLFLDKNANITDTSAKYKSCHGKIRDRTVLQGAVGDGCELLRMLCRGAAAGRNEGAYTFDIVLHCYRYAFFRRVDVCGEIVNVLFLAQSEAETAEQCAWDGILKGAPDLYDEDDVSAYEAYLAARGISERMGRRLTCSKIIFNGYADDRSSSHVAGLNPGSFALAVTSVIKLLDEVTDGRTLKVSFYGGSAVQLEASAEAEAFFGVSEYSGSLQGLLPAVTEGVVPLICTVLAAEGAGFSAEAEVREGKVSILFSSAGMQYPAMDFKYDDISGRIDKLFEKSCSVLSAAYGITSPQEGAGAEE